MFRKAFNDMGKCSQPKLCGGKDNIQINIQYYPECVCRKKKTERK